MINKLSSLLKRSTLCMLLANACMMPSYAKTAPKKTNSGTEQPTDASTAKKDNHAVSQKSGADSGKDAKTVQANAPTKTTSQTVNRVIALVNQAPISLVEFEQAMRLIKRQLREQKIEVPSDDLLKKQVLERLILDRLIEQEASELGIKAEESVIDNVIVKMAQDSKMTRTQLLETLAKDGISEKNFKQSLQAQFLAEKLKEREVDAKTQISEGEIDEALSAQTGLNKEQLKENEYRVAQILVRVPDNADAKTQAEAKDKIEKVLKELKAGTSFASLSASYSDAPEALRGGELGWRSVDMLPELFVKTVQSMSNDQISGVLRSPAGFHVLKLLETRGRSTSQATIPEVTQTRARHILIRINESISEAEAQQKIRDIQARLSKGEDFASLAKRFSMDASANKGGDLGWVLPGQTVPDFEQAMNQVEPMQVSQPVNTPFGIHLIQVLERKRDKLPVAKQRDMLRQMIGERKAAISYQEWLQNLRDRAYVEYRLNDE